MASHNTMKPSTFNAGKTAVVALYVLAVVAAVAGPTAVSAQQANNKAPAKSEAKTKKSNTETTKKAPRKEAVRTLEDINIEGEIAVPQVLFITSRDYRRYRDGLGSKFRLSTYQVARSFSVPTRLRVIAAPGISKEEGK